MLYTYILGLRPIFKGLPTGPGGLADVLTCIRFHIADPNLTDSTSHERQNFR